MQKPIAIIFQDKHIVCDSKQQCLFPLDMTENDDWQVQQKVKVGMWRDAELWFVNIAHRQPLPANYDKIFMKKAHALLDSELFLLGLRGLHLAHWLAHTRFCGACGHATKPHHADLARMCKVCGALFYPKFAAAVMMRITRGDELLLARGPHFPPGIYSNLSGFVEPGETLEQTIEREVMEEVGLKVRNIQYFGSQSWPFPDSYMIAFTAEYASGEISIDNHEIEDAKWFTKDDLPSLPNAVSISRQLIDDFINS